MHIVATRETWSGELRAALVPNGVAKLVSHGFDVSVESKIGNCAGFSDDSYKEAGASVDADASKLLGSADVILHVRRPEIESIRQMRSGAIHLSFLDPFNEAALVEKMAGQGLQSVSLELIPRSTRAQKLDALSSQANLAGYVTVITAASHLPRIFPMMMTPAGTLSPARVFVVGAGVAGLQAIATARRLGARVEAFDTRPVVAEEVRSLGAKFLEIDIGEREQDEQGYAKPLTAEQLALQQQGMAEAIARSDIVITTAAVFGRPAPQIVTRDMVAAMRPSSVVVDMAVESGGNVEGSKLDEIVVVNDVKIVGLGNLPSKVASHASEMYSANLVHFIEEFRIEDSAEIRLDADNEIAAACVLTRNGEVIKELN